MKKYLANPDWLIVRVLLFGIGSFALMIIYTITISGIFGMAFGNLFPGTILAFLTMFAIDFFFWKKGSFNGNFYNN